MIILTYSVCGESYKEQHETGILLRDKLIRLIGLKPEKLVFSQTDKGKPYAEGADFTFSIAHSHTLAICALCPPQNFCGDVPDEYIVFPGNCTGVGIDCEYIEEGMPLDKLRKISNRFLGEDITDSASFYSLWTKKEALGKLTGEGVFSKSKTESCEYFSFTIGEREKYAVCICVN